MKAFVTIHCHCRIPIQTSHLSQLLYDISNSLTSPCSNGLDKSKHQNKSISFTSLTLKKSRYHLKLKNIHQMIPMNYSHMQQTKQSPTFNHAAITQKLFKKRLVIVKI